MDSVELLHELRPLRPRADEAHVAAQHVEDLRQLVDAHLADEAADARDAIVVGRRPARASVLLGVDAHAAELEHAEHRPA